MTITMQRQLIRNARPFDSARGMVGPVSQIVIEGGRIAALTAEPVQVDDRKSSTPAAGWCCRA